MLSTLAKTNTLISEGIGVRTSTYKSSLFLLKSIDAKTIEEMKTFISPKEA
jgi:hypothetical protein